ncbi:hypothetical protein LDE05_15870 [Lactobacillus delbrueckii subsp. bulgaricus]|nr:hypothetical protein LDE05_15870 [Lactobacillus delbrueckii subsp. bulgaricus]
MIFLPGLGFTVLENNLNRYLIDPNRDPNEGLTGDYYHLVYAKNTFGHALYQTPPSSWKINRRRDQLFKTSNSSLVQSFIFFAPNHLKSYILQNNFYLA